jgi:hypothetical protein
MHRPFQLLRVIRFMLLLALLIFTVAEVVSSFAVQPYRPSLCTGTMRTYPKHNEHVTPHQNKLYNVNTIQSMALRHNVASFTSLSLYGSKKKKSTAEEDGNSTTTTTFWNNLRDKPATVVLLPFLFILGLDVILNLLVLTKRSVDYFVFGQLPSTETWW